MHEQVKRTRAVLSGTVEGSRAEQLVLLTGVTLVVASSAFKAWALLRSYFYLDDYNLLVTAAEEPWGLDYLLEPYNSHLMPGGRLLAAAVEASGSLNWTLAALLTLGLQTLAGAAALWMLTTLFGARWAVLAPLTIYLTSAMTVPAMMWWTAGLNQVPLQTAFFCAVACWVRYLRGRRLRWLLAVAAALVLGLTFYVKALLIVPVLLFLLLGYFAEGGPARRVLTSVRTYWPAAVAVGAVLAAYLAYYATHVSAPFTETSPGLVAKIADSMIGEAFAAAAVGGPWRWDPQAPPNAFADAPGWSVHAAWVVIALVVLYAALRRTRTLRAWLLLAIYLACLLGLLVNSRAPVYGRVIGLEYRYLTDAACVLALCLGLAFLTLRGAPGSSAARSEPLLTLRVRPAVTAAIVLVVAVSSLVSTARYVHLWHTENASKAYFATLADDLRRVGAVDLADTEVPEPVVPPIFAPDNLVRRFMPLFPNEASFPRTTDLLAVVDGSGHLRHADIRDDVVSRPGPVDGCGWRVRAPGYYVPLSGRAFEWTWWVRIGYLASADSPVLIAAGDTVVETEVLAGLNDLYVQVDGTFTSIGIRDLNPGVTMCVDQIEVGQPEPGGPL